MSWPGCRITLPSACMNSCPGIGGLGASLTPLKRDQPADGLATGVAGYVLFASAPSPLMAVAMREALSILKEELEQQQCPVKLVAFTYRQISAHNGKPYRTRTV